MRNVVIDGVRYMPVLNAHIGARDIMIALIETYMGTGLTEEEVDRCSAELRVWVTEDEEEGVPTIADFVADLVERLADVKARDSLAVDSRKDRMTRSE